MEVRTSISIFKHSTLIVYWEATLCVTFETILKHFGNSYKSLVATPSFIGAKGMYSLLQEWMHNLKHLMKYNVVTLRTLSSSIKAKPSLSCIHLGYSWNPIIMCVCVCRSQLRREALTYISNWNTFVHDCLIEDVIAHISQFWYLFWDPRPQIIPTISYSWNLQEGHFLGGWGGV